MGYKAFHKGMICNGKQYAENTTEEEKGADSCCKAGVMHYCDEPFDVWDYYPVVDDNGEFTEYAEVEPLAEVLEYGNKRATKKLHIGAKLSFKDFIKAAVSVVIESTKPKKMKKGDYSDDDGDEAKIGSSGDEAQIGSSGNWAKIGSSGDKAKIGSSGDKAKIGSSGNWAKIGSSGNLAQIGSSGNWAKIGSSGDKAKINLKGADSVGVAIGYNSIAKGAVGNWIVLAEWEQREDGTWYPACVKAGQIDGETLKADTWYALKDGEFVEVKDD